MKPGSPHPHSNLPAGERIVDSALIELSRYEGREDSDLVRSILVATVERKQDQVSAPARSTPMTSWLIGSAAVAAVIVVLFSVLSSLPYENGDRSHSEIQFFVSVAPSTAAENRDRSAPPLVAVAPYREEVEILVSSPRAISPEKKKNLSFSIEQEWTSPLPVASTDSALSTRREHIEIDSDEVSNVAGQLVYTGNVELRYRSFLISAEEIRLETEADPAESAFLSADNASFSSEDEGNFPVVAAVAGKLQINPVTGIITLREVDQLETLENGSIRIVDTQEVSITSAGYAIESRASGR